MQAIILCGGKGTRLQSALPEGVPKPMADVCGRPFLYYLLSYWERYIDRFIMATGYGCEQIMTYFGDKFGHSELLYTEPCTTGTMASIEIALSFIDDTAFILNGDTMFHVDPLKMWHYHLDRQVSMTLAYSSIEAMHGGVDIVTRAEYGALIPRASIYTCDAPFIDIGTPENLARFRTLTQNESDKGH